MLLEARNLSGNSVENISFQLHRGEILGFAGLVGSGRSETMEAQARANGVSATHPDPAMMPESQYLGVPVDKAPEALLKKAYPATYANEAMAPLLVQHGTADHLVPWAQSEELVRDIRARGFSHKVNYVPLEGADHEDKRFTGKENMESR